MATANKKPPPKPAAKSTPAPAPAPSASRAVATRQGGNLALSDDLPDYLKGKMDQSRGSENITADDLVIPRIDLVQSLSPARDKNEPEYIEGAEEGMFFNSVTRELYGESIVVVPVYYRHMYSCWIARERGGGGSGGFRGAFMTRQEAQDRVDEGDRDREEIEIIDTGEHLVLIVHEDRVEEAVLSMARSKAKVSKRWNSLVRIAGGDRFSRAYELGSVQDTNDNGDKYYNIAIKLAGYPPKHIYEQAEGLYEEIAKGQRQIKVHEDRQEDESTAADRGGDPGDDSMGGPPAGHPANENPPEDDRPVRSGQAGGRRGTAAASGGRGRY